MERSENMTYAGIIVIVAICIIIGASLLPTLSTYTGQMINTYVDNETYTLSTSLPYTELTGQNILSTPVVINESGAVTISSGNYTIQDEVSPTTGKLRVIYRNLTNVYKKVNITYTYGNDGYVNDAPARAVVPLIIVFFALLILAIGIMPVFRNKLLELVNYS